MLILEKIVFFSMLIIILMLEIFKISNVVIYIYNKNEVVEQEYADIDKKVII